MQGTASKSAGDDDSPGMTADALVRNPRFLHALQESARTLTAVSELLPRIARLVSSHRKWMLTHASYALHLEREPRDPETGITAARLLKFMRETGGASRNTATAFLAELVAYKLLRPTTDRQSKRARPLEPAAASEDAMRLWFKTQMGTLDGIDGGERVKRVETDRGIFERAQPLAARRLLKDPKWTEPPRGVAIFVWAESGGAILDDLMSRPASLTPVEGKVWIDVNLAKLAQRYMVSNTHIRRLFARAETAGFIGKSDDDTRNRYWMSTRLIEEYASWQAIKLEALASAYDRATGAR